MCFICVCVCVPLYFVLLWCLFCFLFYFSLSLLLVYFCEWTLVQTLSAPTPPSYSFNAEKLVVNINMKQSASAKLCLCFSTKWNICCLNPINYVRWCWTEASESKRFVWHLPENKLFSLIAMVKPHLCTQEVSPLPFSSWAMLPETNRALTLNSKPKAMTSNIRKVTTSTDIMFLMKINKQR